MGRYCIAAVHVVAHCILRLDMRQVLTVRVRLNFGPLAAADGWQAAVC